MRLTGSQELVPDVPGDQLPRSRTAAAGPVGEFAVPTALRAPRRLAARLGDRRWLVAAVAAGSVVTLAFTLLPPLRFGYRNSGAHDSLETAAALVSLLVAFLAVGRLERQPRLPSLVLACGLGVLVATNTFLSLIPLLLGHSSGGVVWAAAAGRLCGALLIAVSVFAPPLTLSRRLRLGTTISSALLVSVPVLIVLLLGARLPAVAPREFASAAESPDLHVASAYLALQVTQALLYAVAAVGLSRRASRTDDKFIGWLAVACIFAGFSHVNYFLYPSFYSDWIYLGDVFRLLFFALLLVAGFREIIAYWRIASEVAATNERRRLARDLHDGLAQEIAFIRSSLFAVTQANDQGLSKRLSAAAERAERESRQLLAVLVEPSSEGFRALLTSALRDVADREQIDVDIVGESDLEVSAPRAEALLRIACEAVTNAARHGGVSSVRVTFDRQGDQVRLAVKDAGVGFDPGEVTGAATDGHGFGLRSMRGRAAAVGGQVTISSRRGAGTEVVAIV